MYYYILMDCLNVTTLYLRPGNLKVHYNVDKHMHVFSCMLQFKTSDGLLENIEEPLCIYLRQAFIQMRLQFKDIRYMYLQSPWEFYLNYFFT